MRKIGKEDMQDGCEKMSWNQIEVILSKITKQKMKNPYDTGRRSWLYRLLNKGPLKKLPYPVSGFLIFSIPLWNWIILWNPNIWNIPELAEGWTPLGAFTGALFWLGLPICVILTRWAEDNTFWELWYEMRFIIDLPENDYKALVSKYEKQFYDRKWRLFWITFAILVVIAYLLFFIIYFQDLSVHMFHSIYQILGDGISFIVLGYVLIMASRGTFVCLKITKDLRNYNFKLNPLNPDRFGGMSAIGEIAIELTILTSVILSMYLPWGVYNMIYFSEAGFGMVQIFWYIISTVVSVGSVILILVVFFYPTLNIHYIAKRERYKFLTKAARDYEREYQIYREYREGLSLVEEKSIDEIYKLVEMGTWVMIQNNRYIEAEKMRVYPFTVNTIMKLIGTLIIPTFTAIINQIVLYI